MKAPFTAYAQSQPCAMQLETADLCHISDDALQNVSHTVNAAPQLDINIAVH
jgi:hypothetical protein